MESSLYKVKGDKALLCQGRVVVVGPSFDRGSVLSTSRTGGTRDTLALMNWVAALRVTLLLMSRQ